MESGDILPEAPGDPNRCETACLVGSGFHRREGGQSFHSEDPLQGATLCDFNVNGIPGDEPQGSSTHNALEILIHKT